MECLYCRGKMLPGHTPFSVDRKGYHISWESVPAWVCTQCGESLLEEDEIKHIQNALENIDRETIAIMSKIA